MEKRCTLTLCFLISLTFSFGFADNCKKLCDGKKLDDYMSLEILSDGTSGIILVINSTSNEAIGIDTRSESICLLDATDGFLDVVDINKNRKVVFIHSPYKGDSSVFQSFLKATSDLLDYFKDPKGKIYSLDSVPNGLLKRGDAIESHFLGMPTPASKTNPKLGLELAIKMSKQIIDLFNDSLKGFIPAINNKEINGNIKDFGEILQSLGKISEGGFNSKD